jgi:predicted DNA-binding transcriptional regulator AlpA
MAERLMQRKEVCTVLSISSAGLHRGMEKGFYPKPYRVGQNSVRWKSSEIEEVINRLLIAEPIQVAPGSKRGRKPATRIGG